MLAVDPTASATAHTTSAVHGKPRYPGSSEHLVKDYHAMLEKLSSVPKQTEEWQRINMSPAIWRWEAGVASVVGAVGLIACCRGVYAPKAFFLKLDIPADMDSIRAYVAGGGDLLLRHHTPHWAHIVQEMCANNQVIEGIRLPSRLCGLIVLLGALRLFSKFKPIALIYQ
jgi:hypothetical protein